jgi:hypothetical protein
MQDINNVCEVDITHVKNYEVDIKLTRGISFPWTQGITRLNSFQLPHKTFACIELNLNVNPTC